MFLLPAPEVRDTEVFTRMPQRFRRAGERSDWADANRGGQPTDSFLEGPGVRRAAATCTSPTFRSAASFASTRAASGSWWPSGTASPTA